MRTHLRELDAAGPAVGSSSASRRPPDGAGAEPAGLADADDRTLVGRAVDGDTRAFAVLLTRYGPVMTAYARALLARTDEVDDVVQDAFYVAWEHLGDVENPAGVRGWLLGIVSHKAIDRIRRRRDHDDIDAGELLDPTAGPEQAAVARSREEALSIVLDGLPEQQRRCWLLKSIGGYSYDEIALELDLPASTVRGLLARARVTVMHGMEAWR